MDKYTPLAAQVRARRERFLFLEIVDFLFWGEERSCDGREGAQRLVWRVNEPKKDWCAQRTGAHARPKPASVYIYLDILAIREQLNHYSHSIEVGCS